MTYTVRRTWPDREKDFRHNGKDVGRCYLSKFPDGDRWLWTIYGTNLGTLELTLDEAKTRFKDAFERVARP